MTPTEFADWEFMFGDQGWVNPPPGCECRRERHYAALNKDTDSEVVVWVEDNALQLKDSMDYYPGGCYSVPLSVILKLMELS